MTTALRYCSSVEYPLLSFLHGAQFPDCEGVGPIAQHVWSGSKHALRSTEAAFGIVLTPMLADVSDIPTNPPAANVVAQTQEKLAAAVYQFDLASNERAIFTYLKLHSDASRLLTLLPTIVASVFGEDVTKKLEMMLDREVNELVMTVEIHTGIENEEVFFETEEKLFNLIALSGLENGLRHVVLSLY